MERFLHFDDYARIKWELNILMQIFHIVCECVKSSNEGGNERTLLA